MAVELAWMVASAVVSISSTSVSLISCFFTPFNFSCFSGVSHLTFDATDEGVPALLPPDDWEPFFCFFLGVGVFSLDGFGFFFLVALPGGVADAGRLPTGVAFARLLAASSAALSDLFRSFDFGGMVLKRMGSDGKDGLATLAAKLRLREEGGVLLAMRRWL